MHRIKDTKNPTLSALNKMSSNLSNKFKRSVCISMHTWSYLEYDYTKVIFIISIVPSPFNNDKCYRRGLKDWTDTILLYRNLMTKKVKGVKKR